MGSVVLRRQIPSAPLVSELVYLGLTDVVDTEPRAPGFLEQRNAHLRGLAP